MFPRTRRAIKKLIGQTVLSTAMARAICRKGGLEGLFRERVVLGPSAMGVFSANRLGQGLPLDLSPPDFGYWHIPVSNELFDSSGWYDASAGLYRPKLPGYYRLHAVLGVIVTLPSDPWRMDWGPRAWLRQYRKGETPNVVVPGPPEGLYVRRSEDLHDAGIAHWGTSGPGDNRDIKVLYQSTSAVFRVDEETDAFGIAAHGAQEAGVWALDYTRLDGEYLGA